MVLTTSQAEEDVLRSYQLHADACVTKPVDFDGFVEAIEQIDHFFVSVAQLPTGRGTTWARPGPPMVGGSHRGP